MSSENKPVKQVAAFGCTKPCGNCPYRKDAPLQHWSVEEFKELKASEGSQFGKVYGCHKKNGSTCIGWLMKQDENYFPSIALRMTLSKEGVTREYLDRLSSPSELYDTVDDMIKANYPNL
jgi:hypothetical protein